MTPARGPSAPAARSPRAAPWRGAPGTAAAARRRVGACALPRAEARPAHPPSPPRASASCPAASAGSRRRLPQRAAAGLGRVPKGPSWTQPERVPAPRASGTGRHALSARPSPSLSFGLGSSRLCERFPRAPHCPRRGRLPKDSLRPRPPRRPRALAPDQAALALGTLRLRGTLPPPGPLPAAPRPLPEPAPRLRLGSKSKRKATRGTVRDRRGHEAPALTGGRLRTLLPRGLAPCPAPRPRRQARARGTEEALPPGPSWKRSFRSCGEGARNCFGFAGDVQGQREVERAGEARERGRMGTSSPGMPGRRGAGAARTFLYLNFESKLDRSPRLGF